MTARRTAMTPLIAAAGLLATVALAFVVGIAAFLLPILAGAALLLVARPGAALAVAVGAAIVVESEPGWGPSALPSRIYSVIPGAKITPIEALVLLALAAAVLAAIAQRSALRSPRPFGGALALLALGLVAGAVTGRDAGAGTTTIVNAARTAIPVVLVPLVVVQVVDGAAALRRALGVAGGLAAFKGVAGLAALGAGLTAATIQGVPLTYYEAPANVVMMAFLLYVLAARLSRVALPVWVWAATPFVVAALLLSYRRSFWIAAVLGLAVVAVVAIGRQGRRLVLPLVVLVAVGGYLALTTGAGGQLSVEGPREAHGVSVGSRLRSLNPSSLTANKEDRYRIGERRNVLADLRDSPVAGIGLGVDYRQRYGLSVGDITRQYVHFAALWWWMKLGLLGLAGYVWLIAAGVYAGARVWRAHPDPAVRAGGLAASAFFVAYAVAETTGTFAGADPRSSIVVGAIVGLLAAAHEQAPAGSAA